MCVFSSAHVQETPQKSFILRRFSMTDICISCRKLLSLYSIYWDFTHSNIEFKPHRLISIKQSLGMCYIVFVYVYVSEVQCYVFQRKIYLSRYQIEMIDVCRKTWKSHTNLTHPVKVF